MPPVPAMTVPMPAITAPVSMSVVSVTMPVPTMPRMKDGGNVVERASPTKGRHRLSANPQPPDPTQISDEERAANLAKLQPLLRMLKVQWEVGSCDVPKGVLGLIGST